MDLHSQLQGLFDRGGFLLRKWDSSKLAISDPDEYSKTPGIEWDSRPVPGGGGGSGGSLKSSIHMNLYCVYVGHTHLIENCTHFEPPSV